MKVSLLIAAVFLLSSCKRTPTSICMHRGGTWEQGRCVFYTRCAK